MDTPVTGFEGAFEPVVAPDEDPIEVSAVAIESQIKNAIRAAIDFNDGDRRTWRVAAMKAYRADPIGNEVTGRSQHQATDVRDTIKLLKPSLMRVFFGSEKAVEYAGRGSPQDEQVATLANVVANEVVMKLDNDGFLIFNNWFTDAMTQRLGVVKLWKHVENSRRIRVYDDPATADLSPEDQEAQDAVAIAAKYTSRTGLPTFVRDGDVVRVVEEKREKQIKFDTIPPESFFYDEFARSAESASLIGDRSDKTRGELIAMGVPASVLDRVGTGRDSDGDEEREARDPSAMTEYGGSDQVGALKTYSYVEAYLWVDLDPEGEDSKMEWRRVCTVGAGMEIVVNEPADGHPYAVLCPDPQPHRVEGFCQVDDTMDIQGVKTRILRATLDSLAESVSPRKTVVDGQVFMEDVLDHRTSFPIRQRAPGMIGQLDTEFVGPKSLPMLAYMDELKESRTGITKAGAGLDPDALQSTTRGAVQATIAAAQEQREFVARVFAESGVKVFFRKLLRMMMEHMDEPRIAKLGDKFQEFTPGEWDANLDVKVNVALGTGLAETRMMAYEKIAAKQEQVIATMGMQNPLVSLQQYRNTLAKMVETAGFADVSAFFTELPPDYQPPAPTPPPDPNDKVLALEAERIKLDMTLRAQEAQQKAALDQAKLEFEREKMLLQDDRERDKASAEIVLATRKMELEYVTKTDANDMRREIETTRQTAQRANATDTE